MIAMQQDRVDYQYVRSVVREVFARNDSPYAESPMADYINDKPERQVVGYSRSHYPGQAWNTRVHASESRRPGNSKILIHREDRAKNRMARSITKLQKANQAALSYFYDSNSREGKHPAKALIWAVYLPSMAGCDAKTKTTALMMVDHLLPRYREWLLQGEMRSIKQPWTLFEEIDRDAWYRTYQKHWQAIGVAIERLDRSILDLIR